jgi:hypothetical protein
LFFFESNQSSNLNLWVNPAQMQVNPSENEKFRLNKNDLPSKSELFKNKMINYKQAVMCFPPKPVKEKLVGFSLVQH